MMFYKKINLSLIFCTSAIISFFPDIHAIHTSQLKPDTAALIINDIAQKTGGLIDPIIQKPLRASDIAYACATTAFIPPAAFATTRAMAENPLAGVFMGAVGAVVAFQVYRHTTIEGKLTPVYQLINSHVELAENAETCIQKAIQDLKPRRAKSSSAQSLFEQFTNYLERISHHPQSSSHDPIKLIKHHRDLIDKSCSILTTIQQIASHYNYTPLLLHAQEARIHTDFIALRADTILVMMQSSCARTQASTKAAPAA